MQADTEVWLWKQLKKKEIIKWEQHNHTFPAAPICFTENTTSQVQLISIHQ